MNVKTRFAVAGAIATSVIAVGVGGLLMRETSNDLRSSYDKQVQSKVIAIRPAVSTAPDADRLLDILTANSQDVGLRVLRPNQQEVRAGDVPLRPPQLSASKVSTIVENGKKWRAAQTTVDAASISDVSGQVVIQGFGSTSALDHRIAQLRRRTARIALLSVAVSALASWMIGAYITAPLKRLSIATRALSSIDRGERSVPQNQGVAEIDELGATLNTLLAALENEHSATQDALEAARAFSWNAVHELRSPLMSLRTDIDVLSANPNLPASELTSLAAGMTGQHERVSRLLTALHDLARTDLQTDDKFCRIDVAELAEASCEAALIRHPASTVTLLAPDHAYVNGWDEGLRLAIDNLIDNALKHGVGDAPLCEVAVTCISTGPSAIVQVAVSDSGRGVSHEDRDRLFDRFERGPSTQPGFGLGLAMVKQQAVLHDGTVAISDSKLGGACFTLTLPGLV